MEVNSISTWNRQTQLPLSWSNGLPVPTAIDRTLRPDLLPPAPGFPLVPARGSPLRGTRDAQAGLNLTSCWRPHPQLPFLPRQATPFPHCLSAPPFSPCTARRADPFCKAALRAWPLEAAADGSQLLLAPFPAPQAGVRCLAPSTPSPWTPPAGPQCAFEEGEQCWNQSFHTRILGPREGPTASPGGGPGDPAWPGPHTRPRDPRATAGAGGPESLFTSAHFLEAVSQCQDLIFLLPLNPLNKSINSTQSQSKPDQDFNGIWQAGFNIQTEV